MEFTFGLPAVYSILVIALTEITNSGTVPTDFPYLESTAMNSSIPSNELMTGQTGEPSRGTRRIREVECGSRPDQPNAYWKIASGETVLRCHINYEMQNYIVCNREGKWSYQPQCVAQRSLEFYLHNIETIEPPFEENAASIFCPPPSEQYGGVYWDYVNSTVLDCPAGVRYCMISPSIVSWGYGTQLQKKCANYYYSEAWAYCDSDTGGRWLFKPICLDNSHGAIALLEGVVRERSHCNITSRMGNGKWSGNGRYRLEKSHCQNGEHCIIPNGLSTLHPGTHLIFECEPGYNVKGIADVFCGSDGKFSNDPECIAIRCDALSSESTEADCSYNNTWISCGSPVPPGTIALLSCRKGYRPVTATIMTGRQKVQCVGNGSWQREPMKCRAECGKIPSRSEIVIVGGQHAEIPEFPWHASLYRSASNGSKQLICGATIIQRNILITAAHCVVSESTNRVVNSSQFEVTTGNLFSDFNSPLDEPGVVQTAKVMQIDVHNFYMGYRGNYDRDIAMLRIEQPFTYSAISMPACLDLTEGSDRFDLEPGVFGKFAGFGRTSMGQPSLYLLTLTVPIVSLNDCRNASSNPDDDKFITADKFCGGYRNGSSACDGDSGGGLVFKSHGLWYLRGVVSAALGAAVTETKFDCEKGSYTLFSRINGYADWIQGVIDKYGKA